MKEYIIDIVSRVCLEQMLQSKMPRKPLSVYPNHYSIRILLTEAEAEDFRNRSGVLRVVENRQDIQELHYVQEVDIELTDEEAESYRKKDGVLRIVPANPPSKNTDMSFLKQGGE